MRAVQQLTNLVLDLPHAERADRSSCINITALPDKRTRLVDNSLLRLCIYHAAPIVLGHRSAEAVNSAFAPLETLKARGNEIT